MRATIVAGLRERAREEHARTESRRQESALIHDAAHLARVSRHTEDLIRLHMGLTVRTESGVAAIDGLRLAARWIAVNGHWDWRLCLLEPCVLCRSDVATPLTHGLTTLGALLTARDERNVRPMHLDPLRECDRGGAR